MIDALAVVLAAALLPDTMGVAAGAMLSLISDEIVMLSLDVSLA